MLQDDNRATNEPVIASIADISELLMVAIADLDALGEAIAAAHVQTALDCLGGA